MKPKAYKYGIKAAIVTPKPITDVRAGKVAWF
jgi:hypothetical protein